MQSPGYYSAMEALNDTISKTLTRDPTGMISIRKLASLVGASVEQIRPVVKHNHPGRDSQ